VVRELPGARVGMCALEVAGTRERASERAWVRSTPRQKDGSSPERLGSPQPAGLHAGLCANRHANSSATELLLSRGGKPSPAATPRSTVSGTLSSSARGGKLAIGRSCTGAGVCKGARGAPNVKTTAAGRNGGGITASERKVRDGQRKVGERVAHAAESATAPA
jgi:hypothetical protein